jgi:wyosine [tRNA(Phe)-imidazoG37] synthetase (radical SAM superfamily)
MAQLDVHHHDRDVAGLRYVYPVISRRAGGLSLGINLNVNNACNWRCLYCQVPDLKRGGPPPVDMPRLESELRQMLTAIVRGDLLDRLAPEGMRRFNDIALSGNGEPTSAGEFPQVIELVGELMREFDLLGRILLVLISNGSLMHREPVRQGLARIAALGGEVWFKLDRATAEGMRRINHCELTPEKVERNLTTCAGLCPTWLQTCAFALDGAAPDEAELDAYLSLLARLQAKRLGLRGVLLYGLARASMQPEAPRLAPLPPAWMEAFATRIRALGYTVRVSP